MSERSPAAVASAPGPEPASTSEQRPLLAGVVAWDLEGCSAELPDQPLPEPAWDRFLRLVRLQRAEGPVAAAIAAGALPVSSRQREQAFAAHRAAMSLVLLLERELLAINRSFAEIGIDTRVTKGAATAHLDELDPANRAFGDIDLLVPAGSIEAAVSVLVAAGGIRRHREPRPGYDERFSKGISFRFTRNVEVDLHRTLAPGPFGLRVDLEELFAPGERFGVGGEVLHALDRPGRFLHACYHASLGDARPRLTSLRDIVLTAPRDAAECRIALGRAVRWQASAVVGAAVDHARAELGWQPPEPLASWARQAPRPRRERRWLAAYAGDQRLPALQAIEGIGAIDGFTDRLAYARAIALPDARARTNPLGARVRRGARALARLPRS